LFLEIRVSLSRVASFSVTPVEANKRGRGERGSGGAGEWGSGGVGEWGRGRAGEWESGRAGETTGKKNTDSSIRA